MNSLLINWGRYVQNITAFYIVSTPTQKIHNNFEQDFPCVHTYCAQNDTICTQAEIGVSWLNEALIKICTQFPQRLLLLQLNKKIIKYNN